MSDNETQFLKLVELSKKKYINDRRRAVPGSIFCKAFQQYPVYLDMGFTTSPEKWAEAFLKFDLKSITEVLSEGVFSELELHERNFGRHLPDSKRVVVTRAAKWMMNKEQDPWAFKEITWPTPHELEQIDRGFDALNRVDDEFPLQFPSVTEIDELLRLPKEGEELKRHLGHLKYSQILTKAMQLQDNESKISSVKMAKKLTKLVVRFHQDIFVDAVQFSADRFSGAQRHDRIEHMAYILFREFKNVDSSGRLRNNFDDLSAIRRLAIIRAVAWIRKQKNEGLLDWDFDSTKEGSNLFLSPEEIDRIRKFIARYQVPLEQTIPNRTQPTNNGPCNILQKFTFIEQRFLD